MKLFIIKYNINVYKLNTKYNEMGHGFGLKIGDTRIINGIKMGYHHSFHNSKGRECYDFVYLKGRDGNKRAIYTLFELKQDEDDQNVLIGKEISQYKAYPIKGSSVVRKSRLDLFTRALNLIQESKDKGGATAS